MRFSLIGRDVRVAFPTLSATRLIHQISTVISTLFRNLNRFEWGLLAIFLVSALISSSQLAWKNQEDQVSVPVSGGIYREGLVTTSARDLEMIEAELTKVGLVKLSPTGTIEPSLATEWKVSEDARTVRVRIHDGVSAESVVNILTNQTNTGYWNDADIIIPEAQVVEFRLHKPWAGFTSELVTPIFPYGPFVKDSSSSNANVVRFTRNPAALKPAYLDTIEIRLFEDARALERALRKNTIDGIFSPETISFEISNNWRILHPSLFREHVLLFNVRQEALQNTTLRQKLVRGERLDSPMTLRLVVPENSPVSAYAADLAKRWAAQNVSLNIEEYPLLTLTKTVIPERNYDLLLLGVDYGPDGDLYPYWHSSQIASPGNNFAGYRNKEVDRLLDETRTLADQAARQERYAAVRKIVTDEAVMISFGSPEVTIALSPKVRGEVPQRLQTATNRWTEIASWYIKEKRVRQGSAEQ